MPASKNSATSAPAETGEKRKREEPVKEENVKDEGKEGTDESSNPGVSAVKDEGMCYFDMAITHGRRAKT